VIEYCQGLQTPPRQLIFSCLADKLNAELLSLALSLDWDRVWVPGLDVGRRGVSAQKLARSLGGRPVSDLSRALELALAAEKGVLVCGSLYLLAEFFRLWPGFLADKLASSKE
jgi:dihydrofolate synthase/folylpolyglutamate synthase